MTDLETFVKETLVGIVQGIKASQEATAKTGAKINPKGVKPQGRAQTMGGQGVEDVRFEIALVGTKGRTAKGGGKVYVASGSLERTRSDSSLSRVSFSIPVCWPESTD